MESPSQSRSSSGESPRHGHEQDGLNLLRLHRYEEALAAFESGGLGSPRSLLGMGFALANLGDLARAAEIANSLLGSGSEDSALMGQALRLMGVVHALRGRLDEARDFLRNSVDRLAGAGALSAESLLDLAAANAESGDLKAARKAVEAARKAAPPLDSDPALEALLLLRSGESEESWHAASAFFRKGAAAAERAGSPYLKWLLAYRLGKAAARAGETDEAERQLSDALLLFREVWAGVSEPRRGAFMSTGPRKAFCADVVESAAEPEPQAGETPAKSGEIHREFVDQGPGKDLERLDAIISRVSEPRTASFLMQFRDRFRKLLRLQEINAAMSSTLDTGKLLELIIDKAIEIANAERGFMMMAENGGLAFRIARNIDQENIKKPEFKISHTMATEAASTGRAVISSNASADPRFSKYHSVQDLKLSSVLCVPMKTAGRVTGVIYIDNRFREGVFTADTAAMLEIFASHAASALENARLYQETIKAKREVQKLNEELSEANSKLKDKITAQEAEIHAIKSSAPAAAFKYDYSSIIARSDEMRKVFSLLDRVIETEVPVLIQGESGTGKELVARVLHGQGPRKGKPFLSENCAALTDTLLESELFGHARGSFTGAVSDKKGLFELANGGTLFLDEVSEMSPDMQKKLLRVLQEGELRPVGGKEIVKVDVRIISASNRKLTAEVADGRFREDLFYRMNVILVDLPPLRDRSDDIPLLIEHFLRRGSETAAAAEDFVGKDAMGILNAYHWPGNVRELENLITRSRALGLARITERDLPQEILEGARGGFDGTLDEIESRYMKGVLVDALRKAGGNKTKAARILGIPKTSLYNKMKKYGMEE